MNRSVLPPVLRQWRFIAAVVGAAALAGGGALLAEPSDPASVTAFHGVTTRRVLDTREGTGTPLDLAGTLDVVVPGLPDDATAVAVNVTVVDGTEASFLTMYPTGDNRPTTSTINWSSAGAVANSATVLVHNDHSVRLYNLKGTVHVVLDLIGYYAPAPVGGATGPAGPFGQQGPAGSQGLDGTDGAPGDAGVKGDAGVQGDAGVKGDPGVEGDAGAKGDAGERGLRGADGTSAGPAGFVYLYAYNTADESVLTGQAITFSTAGISNGGIAFVAGGSSFAVPTGGVYRVTFGVIGVEENQISILRNGSVPTGDVLVFGGHGRTPNVGSGLLALVGGDVVTIASLSSGLSGGGAVTLDGTIGGQPTAAAINAWIVIEQLNG